MLACQSLCKGKFVNFFCLEKNQDINIQIKKYTVRICKATSTKDEERRKCAIFVIFDFYNLP